MEDLQLAKRIRSAIKGGYATEVIELLDNNSSLINMTTPFGTWLHVASRHGQLDIVKQLIALGMDVDTQGGISGGKALNEATAGGHLDIVEYLVKHGADLDVQVSEQNALFTAIHGGHTRIAKFLIDNGIDTHVRYTGESMKNMDAIAFAREWGRDDIVELLEGKDARNVTGRTTKTS